MAFDRLWLCFVVQVEAIKALMSVGVAHRDIKADNVLINPDTLQIKLIDFGLATILERLDEHSQDNQFIGTPIYMAPDVLKGFGSYGIVASDLYSVGVLFWEMLLGAHPFREIDSTQTLLRLQRKVALSHFAHFDVAAQCVLVGLLAPREQHRTKLRDARKLLKSLTTQGVPAAQLNAMLREQHAQSAMADALEQSASTSLSSSNTSSSSSSSSSFFNRHFN